MWLIQTTPLHQQQTTSKGGRHMFVIYDEKMDKKEFPQGVRPLDIFISSINRKISRDEVEGINGYIYKGSTFETRNIEVSLMMTARDTRDYRLLRDDVFSFFNGNDYLYISEEYESGKRYKFTVEESFIPERFNQRISVVQFNLEMVNLPFAESIGTTQDIQNRGVNADDELWGFGMGLITDDEALKYTHTGTSFRIYNAGNVPIHPFQQELKITISNVEGSTSFLELKNETNGTLFRVNEGVTNGKTVVLDGPNITSNGLQYLRKTNKQFIELVPGWNEFTVKGATSAKVSFDFRFYYL